MRAAGKNQVTMHQCLRHLTFRDALLFVSGKSRWVGDAPWHALPRGPYKPEMI